MRGSAPVGTSVISVGAKRIEETGAATANELLATVPQATNLFNSVPNATLGIAPNQVQVVRPTLRNIGNAVSSSASTLILFDGHRIAPVGITQNAVDPDLIPAAAIERVEIVPDGGSSTYGSDAVGGVINFITRKRYDGVKVDGHYGFADSYHQVDGSIIVGKDWGTGSLFASYTYQHNTPLFGRDRGYVKQINWNTGIPVNQQCSPGNATVPGAIIFEIPGVFVLRGPGATYALPNTTVATTTPNTCDASKDKSFVPESTRHGAIVGLHQDLADWLTADLRAFYGERSSVSYDFFHGQANVASTQAFYTPLAPDPTATQQVDFSFAPILGRNSLPSRSSFQEWGTNAEFEAKLSEKWRVRTLLNYSRSTSFYSIQQINNTLLTAAGSASNPQDAVNFYNPAATPNLNLIRAIVNDEQAGQGKFDLFNARSIVDGSLFTLPGGDVKLAVGYEYERDSFQQRIAPTDGVIGAVYSQPFAGYRRSVNSFFGELQVPLVGPDNSMGFVYSLTLSGSVRHDRFSDFGNTTNPKFGITYKPISWISLRGNYSTSFNAPSAVDQLGSQRNAMGFGAGFNPFVRDGDTPQVTGALVVQGSNPGLQPQTAKTYSAGIDIDPPFVRGLHASVNYYNIALKNVISIPTPSSAIFNDFPNNIFADVNGLTVAQLQSVIGLAPNGATAVANTIATRCPNTAPTTHCQVYEFIDFRLGNYGTLKVQGLDFALNYTLETGFGTIDAAVSGNYSLSRKQQIGPSSPVIDLLKAGSIDSGRFLMQATLGTTIGGFRGQVTLNHTSGYKLVRSDTLPQDSVDPFDTINLFLKYSVSSESKILRDLSFTLNINNVFDQDPPVYKLYGANGVPTAYSTLGRLVQFGLSKKF